MYLNHFQFQVKPFQPATDPAFFWQGAQYGKVLASLRRGINERKKLMELTGDVGTGKTTLVNALIRSLDDRVHVLRVSDPGLDRDDFLCVVADFLGWPADFSGKRDVVRGYRQFLLKLSQAAETLFFVVDEAQHLSAEISDVLGQFLELAEAQCRCASILLVGQLQLDRMLTLSEHRSLNRHMALRCVIEPLTRDETGAYIAHRIRVAGLDRKLFFDQAVEAVFAFSEGYPRLINTICDNALLTSYARGVQYIGSGLVKECGRELQVPMPQDIYVPEAIEDSPPVPPAEVDAAADAQPGTQGSTVRPFYRILLVFFLCVGTVYGGWVFFHGRNFSAWRQSWLQLQQMAHRMQTALLAPIGLGISQNTSPRASAGGKRPDFLHDFPDHGTAAVTAPNTLPETKPTPRVQETSHAPVNAQVAQGRVNPAPELPAASGLVQQAFNEPAPPAADTSLPSIGKSNDSALEFRNIGADSPHQDQDLGEIIDWLIKRRSEKSNESKGLQGRSGN